ncbi:MAG: aromatic ring-hydroxylating dioxygenase subunit alpha [Deltaproteobacteria bacterium]|nr:aromatic ring-hydroxylating dioxygenase subunit alpha [Deltaproteobacteria bacterium]
MLKNFWYACEFSSRVTTSPTPLMLLGEKLVLYRRSSGEVVCLRDKCVHRGDELSRGRVINDCLACPYHGWQYDESGACVHIPSNTEGQSISKKAKVKSYPTQENYGFIWVFMGDLPEAERPPIPELPEYGQPGWRTFEFDWLLKGHYTRVAENAIDVSHLPFLHSETYGEEQNPLFALEDFEEGEWGGQGKYRHATMVPGILRLRWPKPLDSVTTFTYHLPNITSTRADIVYGTVLLFMSHVPVSATETKIMYLCMRNFYTWPIFDGFVKKGAMNIFLEDQESIEKQHPFRAPLNFAEELHVKADLLPLALRKLRRRCAKKGWCIEEPIEEKGEGNG